LGKSVHLNRTGRGQISGFGLPQIALTKKTNKHNQRHRYSLFHEEKVEGRLGVTFPAKQTSLWQLFTLSD